MRNESHRFAGLVLLLDIARRWTVVADQDCPEPNLDSLTGKSLGSAPDIVEDRFGYGAACKKLCTHAPESSASFYQGY